MADFGKLVLLISASAAQLQKDLDKARDIAGRGGKEMAEAMSGGAAGEADGFTRKWGRAFKKQWGTLGKAVATEFGHGFEDPAQTVGALGGTLSAMPGTLGAIGLAFAALGPAVAKAVEFIDTKLHRADIAAMKLFDDLAAGSISMEQAFGRARVEDLQHFLDRFRAIEMIRSAPERGGFAEGFMSVPGMGGLTGALLPGREAARAEIEQMAGEIEAGRGPIETALRRVLEPEGAQLMLRRVGAAQTANAIRDATRALEGQTATMMMSEGAARRYNLVIGLARQNNIAFSQAARLVSGRLAQMRDAEELNARETLRLDIWNQQAEAARGLGRAQAEVAGLQTAGPLATQMELADAMARVNDALAIRALRQRMATEAEVEGLRVNQEAARAANLRAAQLREAAQLTVQNLTPLEQFVRQMDLLSAQAERGDISRDVLERGAQAALDQLGGSLGTVSLPGAALEGSAAAVAAIARAQLPRQENPADVIRAAAAQQLEQARRAAENTENIFRVLQDGRVFQTVNLGR